MPQKYENIALAEGKWRKKDKNTWGNTGTVCVKNEKKIQI